MVVASEPQLRWVDVEALRPNDWNPNSMDAFMFEKAIASIRQFGFVDPVTCRSLNPGYEIIDGEHRWLAAKQEGLRTIPIFDLGIVDDDTAIQLTIVLNETRGQVDPRRLGILLRDLASRSSPERLLSTLPYTREAFDRLSGMTSLDLHRLGRPPIRPSIERPSAWVERTYRMPLDAAEVVDRAIERIKDSTDESTPDWKALELLAADFLGGA